MVIRTASDSTRPDRVRNARQVVLLAAGELGVAADRGERGAQLVPGVGDELPHPRLALLPGGERRRDVAEHAVERRADLADLGAGVGVVVGHPLGEGRPRRGPAAARRPAWRWPRPVERAQGVPDDQVPPSTEQQGDGR